MREILFRGKRKDNDEWVEGNYGEYYGEYYNEEKKLSCISIPSKETISGSWCYDVIPETVGQFTGLTDKNGVRVFEGDIVCIFDGEYFSGVVKYSNEQGSFTVDDTSLHYWVSDIEVIGNIHELNK